VPSPERCSTPLVEADDRRSAVSRPTTGQAESGPYLGRVGTQLSSPLGRHTSARRRHLDVIGHSKCGSGQGRGDGHHRHIEQPSTPTLERAETGIGRGQAGQRIGHGVSAEARQTVFVGHQAAGHGGVIAEGDAVRRRGLSPVARDRDPHPGPVGRRLLGRDPELLQGAGP
jgi:hypothetical protein